MQDRFLVVIGCTKEKLDCIKFSKARKIMDFVKGNADHYTSIISILRKKMDGDRNLRRSGDTIATDTVDHLSYRSDANIEVPGFDVDCTHFRRDAHYDIVGVSTAASVLCIAMSMYSWGLDVNVLKDYVEDRKGLNKEAFKIMETYMPGVLK